MKTKVVIFDIDGTLINKNKVMPKSTMKAILELQQRGIKVILATGRAPQFTVPFAFLLKVDSYITNNGAMVRYSGDVLYENTLGIDVIREIFEKCHLHGDRAVLQLNDSFLSPGPTEDKRLHNYFKHYGSDLPDNLSFDYTNQDGLQFYIHCPIEKEESYGFDKMDVTLIRYNDYDMDIMTKNMNKAIGINEMLHKIDISPEEVVAFGDGLNDLEMLKYAGTGVALGNAEEELKKVADFVTKSVDEDGILYGLKKLGLL